MKFYEILHAFKGIEDLYSQSQTLSKQIRHLKKSKNLSEEEARVKIAVKEAELKKQLESVNNAKQSLLKSVQSDEEGIDVKKAVALIENITHQLEIEYGIISKEEDAQEKSFILPESIKHLEAYQKHCNPAVYQSLLPFAELAYLFEKNGIPEEHAFKLSTLFGDRRKALAYIDVFATQKIKKLKRPNFYLMHDALLFGMPPPRGCDFKKWCQLAQSSMHEAGFRKLLPNADVIEKAIREDEPQGKVLDKKLRQGQIETARQNLSKKITKWKKLKGQHAKTKQDPKKEKEYQDLTQEISDDRVKLAELYKGTPWSRSSYEMIRAYYERYTMQTSGVFKRFIAHGLTRQDYYEKFLNLKRENAGKNMPKITKVMAGAVVSKTKDEGEQCVIDGAFYGFPGFYMKQINARNDIEAAEMAYGGKLTKSCQSLSGEAGEACVIHGLTSPNGGFYVLCKGDAQAPKSEDDVCGLSWTWRSKENNIVFDSIEMHPDFSERPVVEKIYGMQMGQTLFTALANEMVKNSDIEGVYCGINSGISNAFGYTGGASFNIQQFMDYNGYNDSYAQNLIAHKDYPFLLYKRLFGKEAEAYLGDSIDTFIVNCLDEENIKAIQNLIEFSIANHIPELNQRVTKICGEKHPDKVRELENYSHRCTRCFVLLDKLDEIYRLAAEFDRETDKKEKEALISEMLELVKAGLNPNVRNIGGSTPLLVFLKNNAEKEFLDILLKEGAEVNHSDIHGKTPLMTALWNSADNEIIMALLEKGANVNQSDRNGITPLIIAVNGKFDKAIVEALLAKGANVNYAGGIIHGASTTPLLIALNHSDKSIVEVLLAHGADVNQPNGDGWTPLIVALRAKVDTAIIEAILAKTDDVNQGPASGGSALLSALESNYDDAIIAAILAKGADVNRVGVVGLRGSTTPLILALKKGASKAIIDALLARGANVNQANAKGITPLMAALEKGDLSIMEALLAREANVTKSELDLAKSIGVNQEITVLLDGVFKKYQESQIQTQVQECMAQGQPLHYALQRNFDQNVIIQLLKRGVDINQKDDIGKTPLFEAAQRADQAGVELLVTHRASIELGELSVSRDHPVIYSYLKERANPDVLLLDALQTNADQVVIEDLLKKEANPNYESNYTSALPTALTHAATRDIVQLLIRYGAKIDNAVLQLAKDLPEIYPFLVKHELARKQRLGESLAQPYPLLIAMWSEISDADILALIEQCEDVNRQNQEGHTPLLEALRYKPRMEIISALLERGADVNLPDKEGNSPLMIALENNLDITIITKLLNAKGIHINEVHENGQPVLYSAIGNKAKASVIRLLLEKGADPNLKNSFNQSLLEFSFYCNADEETIGLLLKHGAIVNEEILDKAKVFTSEAIQILLKKHLEEMELKALQAQQEQQEQEIKAQAAQMLSISPTLPSPPLRFSVLPELVQAPPHMIIRKPESSSPSPQEVKQEVADIMETWTDLKDYVLIIKEEMKEIGNEQLRAAMSQLVKTIESHQNTPSNDALANEILPKVKKLSTESGVPQSIQKILNAMLKLEGTKIVSVSGKPSLKNP